MSKTKSVKTVELEEEIPAGPGNLNWMYHGPQGVSSEEYLLGKEYKASKGDLDVSKLANKPGSLFVNVKVNHVLEEEARLREDPMIQIMKLEQEERKRILTNPVKMQKIKQSVKSKTEGDDRKDRKRKKEKKSKKDKKDKKDRRREGSSDSDSDREEQSQRRRSPPREEARLPPRPAVPPALAQKYGLIVPGGLQQATTSSSHLRTTGTPASSSTTSNNRGPSEKPVNVGKLSDAEKQKRLAAMQADAQEHDKHAIARAKRAKQEEKEEKEEMKARHATEKPLEPTSAKFISNLNKQLYMGGKESLEDRISKNKHYRQRGSTEQHSFLKRDD